MWSDDRTCGAGPQRGEQLVAYLYDDLDEVERKRVELHLATCATCQEELISLGGVRAELARWMPPEPADGFTAPSGIRRHRARFREALWGVPVWAQTAAAVLCVGVAASLANLEIRYGTDGLVVQTGWLGSAPASGRDTAAETVGLPAVDKEP